MITGTNDTNKKFIAVILFIAVIVFGIYSAFQMNGSTKKEINDSNSNLGIDPNTPTIKEAKPVVVITSNNTSSTTSNKISNKTSNKSSNKVSNKTSNNNSSNGSNDIPVTYFVTELSANKIYVTGSAKINVDVYPVNATNKKVKYTSTNTNIARVGSDGTVVGVSEGVCYIDIEVDGGGTSRVQIQVFNRESSNVTPTSNITSNKSNSTSTTTSNKVSNSNNTTTSNNTQSVVEVTTISQHYSYVSLNPGGSTKLTYSIYPSTATNKSVTWSSSNTSVATVDSNGTVTAKSAGTAEITVRTNNGKTSTCTVKVINQIIEVTSLTRNTPEKITIAKGISDDLSVTISPSNATNKTISWYSSNTDIVKVVGNGTSNNISKGTVTGINPGTATITARAKNGEETQFTVTVTAPVSIKNGWYTENGERVYYNKGNKLPKYGDFDLTLYDTTAWASSHTGSGLSAGTKLLIKGAESNGNISVKVVSTGETLNVKADTIFVNLPDLMPSMKYDIKSAYANNFTVGGYNISNVTNVKLYKFSKASNSKIGRSEYYAPLLYPAAVYLQKALNNARSQGYNFIIYDTYRPTPVEEIVYENYMNLYNNNSTVRSSINRNGYNINWFMTSGYSKHSEGLALDMGLTDSSGNVLAAQTNYGVLDESSVVNHNNANANKLKSIMTSVKDNSVIDNSKYEDCKASSLHGSGEVFFSLKSEWWHFDLRCTKYERKLYESFYITN